MAKQIITKRHFKNTQSRAQWVVESRPGFVGMELIRAFENENIPKLRALIDAGASVNIRERNNTRHTLLMRSVDKNKSPEIIELLLKAGADIEAEDRFGQTALAMAIEQDRYEAAKMLVKYGANVNAPIKKDSYMMRSRFLDDSETCGTMLTKAVMEGRNLIVRLLIDAGAVWTVENRRKQTLLIKAVEMVDVRYIYQENETESITARGDNTIIQVQRIITMTYDEDVKRQYINIINMLIEAGIDIDKKDSFGKKAVDYVADGDVKKILEEKAAVSAAAKKKALLCRESDTRKQNGCLR